MVQELTVQCRCRRSEESVIYHVIYCFNGIYIYTYKYNVYILLGLSFCFAKDNPFDGAREGAPVSSSQFL